MSIPEWWEAPDELLRVDGHCGLVAGWQVLRHFRRRVPVETLRRACAHTIKHGVFTVGLAAGLREFGLAVEFFSDPDGDIGAVEMRCYRRALRLGVSFAGPPSWPALLRARHGGAVLVVFFDTPSGEGHFSPVTAARRGSVFLPLADERELPIKEFLRRWEAPRVLRQALLVRRGAEPGCRTTG